MNISRQEQDEYAINSYKKSAAFSAELAKVEITPVEIPATKVSPASLMTEDEEFKRVNFDKFSKLPTVFQKENGSITAGNASTRKWHVFTFNCLFMPNSFHLQSMTVPLLWCLPQESPSKSWVWSHWHALSALQMPPSIRSTFLLLPRMLFLRSWSGRASRKSKWQCGKSMRHSVWSFWRT